MAIIDETYCRYSFPLGARDFDALTDQDILRNFDPPMIPPRVAFRREAARRAVGKEITDLPKVGKGSPPAMVGIRLDDGKYRHLPRIPITLAIKRKSLDSHNGRLCARGGVGKLSAACFVSSPTVRRSSIKIV